MTELESGKWYIDNTQKNRRLLRFLTNDGKFFIFDFTVDAVSKGIKTFFIKRRGIVKSINVDRLDFADENRYVKPLNLNKIN